MGKQPDPLLSDLIARLRADLAASQAECERLTGCLSKANAQAEHFEREWYLRGDEIERLRADAERYRWLRNMAPYGPTRRRPVVWMTVSHAGDAPDTQEEWLECEELDAAIDAARAGKGE